MGWISLSKRRSEKLERFVVNNLDSEEQLEKLITILYKEAESRKFSGIFIRGLGIGLFLPLWNFFVRSGFESGVNNINDAFALFIILALFILLIIYFASMLKFIVMDFFDRESTRINDLANMLEDISFKKIDFSKKIVNKN